METVSVTSLGCFYYPLVNKKTIKPQTGIGYLKTHRLCHQQVSVCIMWLLCVVSASSCNHDSHLQLRQAHASYFRKQLVRTGKVAGGFCRLQVFIYSPGYQFKNAAEGGSFKDNMILFSKILVQKCHWKLHSKLFFLAIFSKFFFPSLLQRQIFFFRHLAGNKFFFSKILQPPPEIKWVSPYKWNVYLTYTDTTHSPCVPGVPTVQPTDRKFWW